VRPRTLWRLSVIVGMTLASAVAGGIYGRLFAPSGSNSRGRRSSRRTWNSATCPTILNPERAIPRPCGEWSPTTMLSTRKRHAPTWRFSFTGDDVGRAHGQEVEAPSRLPENALDVVDGNPIDLATWETVMPYFTKPRMRANCDRGYRASSATRGRPVL
jgi:hypothetical protein